MITISYCKIEKSASIFASGKLKKTKKGGSLLNIETTKVNKYRNPFNSLI